MKDILLIERGRDELNDRFFGHLIEGDGDKALHRESLRKATSSFILHQRDYAAAVFDSFHVDRQDASAIAKISALTEGMPILVIAKKIDIEAYRRIDTLRNVVTLQRYFNVDVCRHLLRKMSTGLPFKPVVCPRFYTDDRVQIRLPSSGEYVNSQLLNYSAGGMYIRTLTRSLKIGDTLQISVPTSILTPDENRAAVQLDARIIWRKHDDGASGIGVQFLAPLEYSLPKVSGL